MQELTYVLPSPVMLMTDCQVFADTLTIICLKKSAQALDIFLQRLVANQPFHGPFHSPFQGLLLYYFINSGLGLNFRGFCHTHR